MEETFKLRKAARDSFGRSRKGLGLNEDGKDFEMTLRDLALENGKHRFFKFLRRQRRFLDAVTPIIKYASDGHQILDALPICEKQGLDPIQYDITVEIGQLFHSVVSKPSSKLRCYVDNNVDSKLGKFAKNLILNMVAQPIEMLIDAGSTLLAAYLKQDDHSEQKQRFRISAVRILMHLSDCFRYRFDHETAQKIAEVMLFSDSRDPEAYMRLAMNAGVATDFTQDLTPFFHYCVFLDNRNVIIEHAEAKIVHQYVKEILGGAASDPSSVRNTSIVMFVDAVWVLLAGDMKEASRKIRDEALWKSLTEFVKKASRKDVLCMIGALMFSHYRSTTESKGGAGGHLQLELADFALSRLVTVLAESVAEKLKEVKTMVRNRKRNRRRAIQKKRKKDPHHFIGDANEIVAFEALNHVGPLEEHVLHLGALSFMTHYWCSEKVQIRQSTDVHIVASALRSLQAVVRGLRLINELTSTLSLSEHIEHRALKNSRALPALFEDVFFCNSMLCEKLRLFQDVRISGVTFESLFNSEAPNLRKVIDSYETATYESIAQATAARYMRAFSLRCTREAKVNVEGLGLVATISVVTTILRKQRIANLISELEKFGGGRIARMLIQVPNAVEAQRPDHGRDSSLSPPLPGQPPFQEGRHILDEQESVEIDALSRKRRRVIGSYTPAQSKAQYTIQSDGESDSIARSSPSLNRRRESYPGTGAVAHSKRVEHSGKDTNGHSNGISKEQSGLPSRIREPMSNGKVSIQSESLAEERKGTTLRLLQLMYPAHTNSVSHLCCGKRDNSDWRRQSSEPPYAIVTTFPVLEDP